MHGQVRYRPDVFQKGVGEQQQGCQKFDLPDKGRNGTLGQVVGDTCQLFGVADKSEAAADGNH